MNNIPHPNLGPPPRIVLFERYKPRVCAAPGCPLPPHVRWKVAYGGVLYGMYRRIGDNLDLCDRHEKETVDITGADWDDQPTPPRVGPQLHSGPTDVTCSEQVE